MGSYGSPEHLDYVRNVGNSNNNRNKMRKCPNCGAKVTSEFCPICGTTMRRKPVYKRWWFWLIIIVVGVFAIGSLGGGDDSKLAAVSPGFQPGPQTSAIYQGSQPNPQAPADNFEQTSGVTLDNFGEVKTGMSYSDVRAILGVDGELMSQVDIGDPEYETEIYTWDGRGMLGANCNVTFQGGKVVAKAQIGLK
ncbi:hypothetical protein SAMN02745823_03870 [Sporobacter termitidis DSM 10068]|uniref:Zinc-ribbon domain-containing protein n=1 Tax=Sporobacter termitidis DSM 10068 TaxID=1123282 RepID=A0A1M5ZKW0_9FIRM|nr:hypothetical protein [Sporobacter termitidis]SHI24814.1 hypothetical protein SAMN02745823_03870 [Sporobacter termitidis DSM 10068]